MAFTLYDYFRSSASYRVRIALNIKQLDYTCVPISLLDNQQNSRQYKNINATGLLPTLEHNQYYIYQSLAIIEYLEQCYPTPSLLPCNTIESAQCRAFALSIACDIHPLNNLRVLNYLERKLTLTAEQKQQWYHHWIEQGFTALEHQLASNNNPEKFCFGLAPTLADIFLIPQVYNARRFNIDLSKFPIINTIEKHCNQLEPFIKAAPHL